MSHIRSARLLALPLLAALLLALPSRALATGSSSPVAPPSALSMSLAPTGLALPAGSWISSTQIDLRFQASPSGPALTPEAEVEPLGTSFKNQANFTGTPVTGSTSVVIPVQGLANGVRYHWQARLVDGHGSASDWVAFSNGSSMDFGIDRDPPSRPVIQSSTNPHQNRWYHNRIVQLAWSSTDAISGIQGYVFAVGHRIQRSIKGKIEARSSMRLANLGNGVWYAAVAAVDLAGNQSSIARFRLRLDRSPPRLIWLSRRFTFNPYRGPASVRFRVSKTSDVRARLYRLGSRQTVAEYHYSHLPGGRVTTIWWSGRDRHGRPLAKGYYFFSIQVIDHAGNLLHSNAGGIWLDPAAPLRTPTGQILYADGGKVIIISLARETLYAYDGVKLRLTTYVTTGNPDLPTPRGQYQILAKYSPFEFISPWPEGSPFWYPPSMSNFAMLFQDQGYFIHDAPWRGHFGPGSNGPGQPGSDYGGTHGCVNVPYSPMVFLWNWTPTGTRVLVV